jgi:hypothetical protein
MVNFVLSPKDEKRRTRRPLWPWGGDEWLCVPQPPDYAPRHRPSGGASVQAPLFA